MTDCSLPANEVITVDLNQLDTSPDHPSLVEGILDGYTHISIHIEKPSEAETKAKTDVEKEWIHLCVDAEIQTITPLADFIRIPKMKLEKRREDIVKDIQISSALNPLSLAFTLFGSIIIIVAGFLIAKIAVMRRRHLYTPLPSENSHHDDDDDGIIEV